MWNAGEEVASVSASRGYDVLVVGAGTAGIPCAVEASRHGARVLVVEKDARVGGTLHISGGHLSAGGTRRQAARGVEDDPAAHLDDIRRISGGTAREDIVGRAVALAPAVVDWLEDNGFDFAPETPVVMHEHEPYSVARTYYGRDEGLSLLRVLDRLLDEAVGSGAVELRTSTAVTELHTDAVGRVVGATLTGRDGEQYVEAGAVILATGGFAADPEVFGELEGVPLVSAAMRTSTGDGLLMARALGAGLAGRGMHLPTFGGMPEPDNPARTSLTRRSNFRAAERPPYEIYVDRSGRRFVAEDEPSIDAKERALLGTDDLTFWMVVDDRARRESAPPLVNGWSPDDLAAQAGHHPAVAVADDLTTLAVRAGIDAEGLVASVAEYNAALGVGGPDPLGRRIRPAPIERPPFYALRNHGIALLTFTGVDVDAELRVRREDGSAIAGLYAVGEVIGNAATAGNSFCGGMSVTPALALGRWLGAQLAVPATCRRS
jgi:succinate dehydrogenase/fumarate reductase flavoprotein subunit